MKEKTPEQNWDDIKSKLFKNGVVDSVFDESVKRGFRESVSENEKWQRLAIVLMMFKNILHNKTEFQAD